MLPIDGEFGILYIFYLILFCFCIFQIIIGNKFSRIKTMLILSISILLNVLLYSNSNNFEGGGSLVVLFYSGIIYLFTLLAIVLNQFLGKRK
ncbi:hypothetical protein EMST110833_06100 [Empedobacter stercoris]